MLFRSKKKADGILAPGGEMAGEKNFGTRKEKYGAEVVGAKERKVDISWLVRGKKKSNQLGRSMIEMLGVLAIIGVLSIAGIAGYSAAMGKWQITKYRESLNLFLSEAVKLLPQLERQYGKGTTEGVNLNSLFANTSMLPDGMYYDETSGNIYDIFKNQNIIRYKIYQTEHTKLSEYYITIRMQPSEGRITPRDQEICRNVFLVTQGYAENIHLVQMYASMSGQGTSTSSGFLGGMAHSGGSNLLKDATLNDFNKACQTCNSASGCIMVIYFSSKHI